MIAILLLLFSVLLVFLNLFLRAIDRKEVTLFANLAVLPLALALLRLSGVATRACTSRSSP